MAIAAAWDTFLSFVTLAYRDGATLRAPSVAVLNLWVVTTPFEVQ